MTDWTSLVPVGGTGLRPGDCRSMASRFCTVALLFPSLYISPLSFLLTFLLLLRATTVPFRRGNVADSRPREIASRTVVFQCLIREGGRAHRRMTGGDAQWRNSMTKLSFRSSIFNSILERGRGGGRNRGLKFDGGEFARGSCDLFGEGKGFIRMNLDFFLNLLSICKTQDKINSI